MKSIIKMILVYCLKPLIFIVALLPAKKRDGVVLEKYRNSIAKIRKRGGVYIYEKCNNQPVDTKIDLSIIVPVYNVEQYLKQCIDSLLSNKTKYNFEIIAINDGSTDNSLKILKSYRDKRLKIINKKNGGFSSARNTGLDNAVGKYVAFVDSDDYVTSDFVEIMMDVACKTDSDIVRAGYYVLDNTGAFEVHTKGIKTTNDLGEKVLECSGYVWGMVIKRYLFYDVRFPVGYIFEDMITRPLILTRAKSYIEIDKCIYYYRQRNGSITHQINNSVDNRCLDQYYLPREIYKYGLKIGVDKSILTLIIFRELELISFMRLRKMNREIKKGVFELNAEFVDELSLRDDDLLDWIDKFYLKSFLKRNYLLYVLVSMYVKCKK